MSEIVRLNVGGSIIKTKRSILNQIEDVISEVRGADENGNIFLDLNPKYFGIVLNYPRLDILG